MKTTTTTTAGKPTQEAGALTPTLDLIPAVYITRLGAPRPIRPRHGRVHRDHRTAGRSHEPLAKIRDFLARTTHR